MPSQPSDRPPAAWAWLFSTRRADLGRWLASHAAGTDTAALQAGWLIEAQRLPHEAERLMRRQPVREPGVRALLQAAIAEQYDDALAALAFAEQALAQLTDPLDPLHLWALRLLGMARLECGDARQASSPLQDCLRGAHRDGLLLLQLDALRALARVQALLAGPQAARPWLEQGVLLLAQAGLEDLPAAQSIRRQVLQERQQQALLTSDEAPAPVSLHSAADALLAAQALRLNGDAATARQQVQALSLQAAQLYWPLKWQMELAQLRARLGLPAQGPALAGPAARSERPHSLVQLQLAVHEAGQARLAGQPWSAARLDALAARLLAQGLLPLHTRLALVRSDSAAELGQWLHAPGRDALDALALAPVLLPWVQERLQAKLPRDERLAWQHLLAQLIGPRETPARNAAAPTPGGLTRREWQVLQLIGDDCSNAQIATQLSLSEATVKTHINRLYAKLGLQGRLQAVQMARRLAALAVEGSAGQQPVGAVVGDAPGAVHHVKGAMAR